MNFLEEIIITKFGAPIKITVDNVKDFSSLALEIFFFKYGIVLPHSSNYYPQGNGMAQYRNKNLMNIIKNTMGANKKKWDNNIKYAVWTDRIGIIVINVKGLMMPLISYYVIKILTTFLRSIYIYRSTSILKKGCM